MGSARILRALLRILRSTLSSVGRSIGKNVSERISDTARRMRALPRLKFLQRFDQIPRQRLDAIENAVGNWFRR